MRTCLLSAARVLGLITLLSCCATPGGPTSMQKGGDAAAFVNALHGDFVAALKRRHWSDPDDGFEACVLLPETILPEEPWSWEWLQEEFPGLERGTYDRFGSANERARPIAPLDRGAMKLHVLEKAEAAELDAILHDDTRGDYWDILCSRYGEVVRIGISAPGFSEDRQQALIYYEAGFDWLGGWGCYCLLKREGDRWEIADECGVWES